MSKKYQNFIGGEWVDSRSGEIFTNRNPANREEIVGVFPKSNKEDVDKAVKTASKAYDNWRLVPVPERGEIMKKTGDITANRKEEIAQLMIFGPTIGAECHMPFGGVKETGNGHREGGWQVYEFFSEIKTCYVDFSDKRQRAQIDNRYN